MLSPHTAITFTATASFDQSVVVPAGSVVNGQNGYFDWAPIQVDGKAFISVDNDVSLAINSQPPCFGDGCKTLDYLENGLRNYSTTEQSQSKLLSLTVSNDTVSTLSKTLSAVSYTNGYATAPLSLVPEPSTWALTCVGLAGIAGAMARRRRVNVAKAA